VTFLYRGNADAARDVVDAARAAGHRSRPSRRTSRRRACAAAVERTAERTGRIDVLVNNAGVIRDNQLPRCPTRTSALVLDTNIGGVFNMRPGGGAAHDRATRRRIINLSSVPGEKGGRGQTNYAASKGAINAFTRCARGGARRRGASPSTRWRRA
jgi:3-oxoacyl-[acyl-carrier protein] reductase